ncbi:proprotein convertase subtilisin/kexin type 4-like isoform X2 [Mercenaria mercenaria]|uniref:proprotein convertase subtilisin/kexin type 4-like isoform X2 n=1 Tax=Mercenaria mercenaria TaxID=6596 RepID=UPI00234EA5F5|nr:proprotein convertase subtilisin/kexin type 4-like isoform X2 [Mercenaria mercenaria]
MDIRIKMTIFTLILTLSLMTDEIYTKVGVKYVLRIKRNETRTLCQQLLPHNLTLRNKITPSTYIFEYTGFRKKSTLHRTISKIKKLYKSKITALERVREYKNTLKPGNTLKHRDPDWGLIDKNVFSDNILNNTNLSYNFIDDSSNVTPEYYHNLQKKSSHFTDHGNKVASIIAATKGNGICSAGIAHNSTIIALKIYKVKLFNNHIPVLEPSHWTCSDIIARALVYNLDTIDIFANAWAPTKPFDTLDLATRDAVSYGAKHGRHGLGTIHVVPSGPPGNELSNNVYTITVNSIGRNGAVPDYTYTDASVLTSGLGEGNNLTSSSMVTTTLRNRCITGFNGVSAATAQVTALIGLALGANKNLSLRDVQHLLVHTSDYKQLRKEKIAFQSNAAGIHFHGVFGFGLVNADKLISQALIQTPTPKLRTTTLYTYITRTPSVRTQTFEFCHSCDKTKSQTCLAKMEHIMVKMNLKSSSGEIKMAIKSPGGTTSVLMYFQPKRGKPVAVSKLRLVSVHFWDEIAFGPWVLYVQDRHSANETNLSQLSVTLYGTAAPAIARFQQQYSDICTVNTTRGKDVVTTSQTLMTSAPHKSPKTTKNTKPSSDVNVKVVLPVLMVLVLFLFILYKRYNMSVMSLLSYCPTRTRSVSSYTNVLSEIQENL